MTGQPMNTTTPLGTTAPLGTGAPVGAGSPLSTSNYGVGSSTSAGDARERLSQALEAHRRIEIVDELALQADIMRTALAKLFTQQERLSTDPVWRDDLAFELNGVLRVINQAVGQLTPSTITLDEI